MAAGGRITNPTVARELTKTKKKKKSKAKPRVNPIKVRIKDNKKISKQFIKACNLSKRGHDLTGGFYIEDSQVAVLKSQLVIVEMSIEVLKQILKTSFNPKQTRRFLKLLQY